PLSLTWAWRLMSDSARSPATAAQPSTTPRTIARYQGTPKGLTVHSRAAIIESTKPPKTPSHVLPGLIRGASLCRPNKRPVKKAAVSKPQTPSRTVSNHHTPRGNSHQGLWLKGQPISYPRNNRKKLIDQP